MTNLLDVLKETDPRVGFTLAFHSPTPREHLDRDALQYRLERHATCIYSQLKTCSSSEVAAMIQGVLRHCTELEVDRHYVDNHGQSIVRFAFCRLLGFELLPRLKKIHSMAGARSMRV